MKGQPLLIDANSLIVRNIMATVQADLKAGTRPTGGTYATLNTLRSFLESPEGHFIGPVVALFDNGIPPARLKLLPDYKKERANKKKILTDEQKEEAFQQIQLSRTMLELLGVLCLSYKDREADDAVAAAARLYADVQQTPVVVTGDKDLWQTVGMGARVWDLNQKRWIDNDTFLEAAGVEPGVYIVYRALLGDPSDSIQGSPGCGPKRARGLLQEIAEEDASFPLGPPHEQLNALRDCLVARKKKRKFELAFLDSFDYLQRVIRAIDLRRSFGSLKGLRKRLGEFKPHVNAIGFLRFCKQLEFNSVLGDPERFLRPFRGAASR